MNIKGLTLVFCLYLNGVEFVSGVVFDGNGNGVSDIWEARYGLVNPSPDSDADRDGQSDREEGLNGTDPADPESVFRLSVERRDVGQWFLTWRSREGFRYRVQTLEAGGEWQNLSEEIPGNNGLVGFVDSDSVKTWICYRVAVVQDDSIRPEIQNTLAVMDTDGDGQNDWIEWLAGTSLIDPEEVFSIDGFVRADTVTLAWPTVKGMSYCLQTMNGQVWVDVGGIFFGDGTHQHLAMEASDRLKIYRMVATARDADADGLTDWEEYLAGLDPQHPNSVEVGRSDVELVRQQLDQGGILTVEVLKPVLNVTQGGEGALRVRRKHGFAEVTVPLLISGDAVPGEDYEALPASVTLPFGVNEVTIPIKLLPGVPMDKSKHVILALSGSADYQLGEVSERSVTLLKENLINIRDHGALGDGNTDDGAAIQRAIDDLENSPEFNGLYFPAGTYRLAHPIGDSSAPTGSYRFLKLGGQDLTGRDLILRGDPGSVLYSDVGSARVNMLLCIASFRSLLLRDLRFAQSSVPLWPTPGYEPNGSDGVTVLHKDGRFVERIGFSNCEFLNCHRSVSIYGRGYDIRGRCGALYFENCRFLNPYGANTRDSLAAWGGGQQVYMAPWVADARYEDCVFDGGGEDMTDAATAPGGRLKDGGHFGCPLKLVFQNNVVRRMGVEAFYQINDNTFMGATTSSFVVPTADGVSEVLVKVNATPSNYVSGETLVVRTALIPGMPSSNTFLTIRGYDPDTRELTLSNPGAADSLPPGTLIVSGKSLYLDERSEPTHAWIEDNLFEGDVPPGGVAFQGRAGICFDARATVTGNMVSGYVRNIYSPDEVHTPNHPAARGSLIAGNVVITSDPRIYDAVYTYGVHVWGSNERILENLIYTPSSRKMVGIVLRGDDAVVSGNTLISMDPVENGYESELRAVGIGMGNTSRNTRARSNKTRGFDVGIGSARPFQARPYFLDSHFSVQDVLAIDRGGIISE